MKNLIWIICPILVLLHACRESAEEPATASHVKRYGMVIRVKPEKLDEYKALHADPWPGVNRMIKACNIRNYSIYYRDGYLFSYFEYTGEDFEEDMAKMAADSLTREWWKRTDPCQEPVETAGEGVWWADMEEVYHLD
jgi:L-rhamnose mutarotase